MALSYDLALDPEHQESMTTVSPLTGERINRLAHVYQNTDDLIKRFDLMRDLARRNGMCVGARCVSGNILSALHTVTYVLQENKGTPYHKTSHLS